MMGGMEYDVPVEFEWLLGVLADIEHRATAVTPLGETCVMGGEVVPQTFAVMRMTTRGDDGSVTSAGDRAAQDHFMTWQPDRVLALVRAIRRVLDRVSVDVGQGRRLTVCAGVCKCGPQGWCEIVRDLARPFADWPGRRPTWAFPPADTTYDAGGFMPPGSTPVRLMNDEYLLTAPTFMTCVRRDEAHRSAGCVPRPAPDSGGLISRPAR